MDATLTIKRAPSCLGPLPTIEHHTITALLGTMRRWGDPKRFDYSLGPVRSEDQRLIGRGPQLILAL